jgi:hypothetical protein
MGYDLHIVRGPDYFDNPAHQITADEWLRYVESDPELKLAGYNGPHFALWTGKSEYPDPWIDWSMGAIYSKNPDAFIVAKMLQIAELLRAQVRGDDNEIYTSPTEYHYDD